MERKLIPNDQETCKFPLKIKLTDERSYKEAITDLDWVCYDPIDKKDEIIHYFNEIGISDRMTRPVST